MRAVNERLDAAVAQLCDQTCHRQYEGGGAGYVIEQCQPRPRRGARHYRLDDFLIGAQRKWYGGDDDPCAAARGDVVNRLAACGIGMSSCEQLVSWLER